MSKRKSVAAVNRQQRLIRELESEKAQQQEQIDNLRAAVKEWLCEQCNYVYPGPPSKGFACVMCPRCDGSTMPRQLAELRHAKAQSAQQQEWFANWRPTAENINALPEKLRQFVVDLETQCDPAGMVAENALVKDNCRILEQRYLQQQEQIADLTKAARELLEFSGKGMTRVQKGITRGFLINRLQELIDQPTPPPAMVEPPEEGSTVPDGTIRGPASGPDWDKGI